MFIRELGGAGLFGESQSKQVRVMLGVSLGSVLMEFNPDLSSPRRSPRPIITSSAVSAVHLLLCVRARVGACLPCCGELGRTRYNECKVFAYNKFPVCTLISTLSANLGG